MRRLCLCFLWGAVWLLGQSNPSVRELARRYQQAPTAPETVTALRQMATEELLQKGTAAFSEGDTYLYVVRSATEPEFWLDDQRGPQMRRVDADLWAVSGQMETGRSHWLRYRLNGKWAGGKNDVPAFPAEAYAQPGVPQGTLHGPFTQQSKIYEGMTTQYWVYAPAQYNASQPAALMVWQDGQGLTRREGGTQLLNVVDNLTHQKRIPVIVHVLIAPGQVGERRMRSILYDTVDDTYPRYLRDEILPEVYSKWNIRRDAYSRAIAGNSSGGICAFNAAWQQPDQFSRVLSRIGSFTSIQWKPNVQDGGHEFPNMVRKGPKKNLRVWLQDGAQDLENTHGSWPLQNIQMANSLKMRDYDFHLSWGNGSHNGAHGNSQSAEELTWLWRDYNPSRTEQQYEMEESERKLPLFRVALEER